MSSLLRIALLLALSCLPSKADEQDVNRQDRTKNVGRGLLCDTSQQAERFVTLRDDGKDVEVALQNVNEEAHKSNACGIALVVFTGGERSPIRAFEDDRLRSSRSLCTPSAMARHGRKSRRSLNTPSSLKTAAAA